MHLVHRTIEREALTKLGYGEGLTSGLYGAPQTRNTLMRPDPPARADEGVDLAA
jgi:hypothetical protein